MSAGKLLNDFENIARRLRLVSSTSPPCTLVADWLNDEEAFGKKCLMIIDNLDSASILDQPLEGQDRMDVTTGQGKATTLRDCLLTQLNADRQLLLTTRTQDVAASICGADSWIHVGCLEPEESIALFKSRLAAKKDLVVEELILQDLAKELDHIPLAITQAAAFITRNNITLTKYLDALRSSDSVLARYLTPNLIDDRRAPGMPNSIFLTWRLSFEEIMKTDPSAGELLSVLSMLAVTHIPRYFISSNSTSDEVFSDMSFGTLESYCLLKQNTRRSIQVHSLVAASVRAWLRHSNRFASSAERAALLMADIFPAWEIVRQEPNVFREKLSILSPHAIAVLRNHEVAETSFASCSQLLRCLAGYEIYLGLYNSAWEHVQLLDEAQTKFAKKGDIIKLQTMLLFTSILIRRSQFSKAERIQRQALSEFEKVLRPSSREILRSYLQLAVILKEQNQMEEANATCLKALDVAEKTYGSGDVDCLKLYSISAEIFERQGQYAEAQVAQQKAYSGFVDNLGSHHYITILSQGIIARLLKRRGDGPAAIALSRETYSRMLQSEGEDHPASTLCLWWLAFALAEDQQYEEAESLYEQLIRSMELIWGSDHPDLDRCRQQHMAVKTKTFHLHLQTSDADSLLTDRGLLKNEPFPSEQQHMLRDNEYEYLGQLLNQQAGYKGIFTSPTGSTQMISNTGSFTTTKMFIGNAYHASRKMNIG